MYNGVVFVAIFTIICHYCSAGACIHANTLENLKDTSFLINHFNADTHSLKI